MEAESKDVSPYCFVCIECHSDQRINPFSNSWVQQGMIPPCKFCGGIVIYVEAESPDELVTQRANALKQNNRERGVPG